MDLHKHPLKRASSALSSSCLHLARPCRHGEPQPGRACCEQAVLYKIQILPVSSLFPWAFVYSETGSVVLLFCSWPGQGQLEILQEKKKGAKIEMVIHLFRSTLKVRIVYNPLLFLPTVNPIPLKHMPLFKLYVSGIVVRPSVSGLYHDSTTAAAAAAAAAAAFTL